MDFAALAVRGPKCWIAGTPGSRVLHSPDGGRTWSIFPTPSVAAPGRASAFPTTSTAGRSGAMGTILASEDGGRTWRRQRAGGGRAALLGLFCREDDVPLELLARLAGDEGYLSVVDVLGRRDVETAATRTRPIAPIAFARGRGRRRRLRRRNRLAVSAAAGRACAFPPARSSTVGTASTAAAACKTWRPTSCGKSAFGGRRLSVTQCGGTSGDDAAEQLVAQAVAGAIRKAADPRAFPAQIDVGRAGPVASEEGLRRRCRRGAAARWR